jgi:DnaJ-class molecular chaperone
MKASDCPHCFGTGKSMNERGQPRLCKHCGGVGKANAHISAAGRPIHQGDRIEHVSGHYGRGRASLGTTALGHPYVKQVTATETHGGGPEEFRHVG